MKLMAMLFNALKAIETSASGTIKVYGLPLGQGLDRRVDMAQATGLDHRAVHKPSQCPQFRLLLLKKKLLGCGYKFSVKVAWHKDL